MRPTRFTKPTKSREIRNTTTVGTLPGLELEDKRPKRYRFVIDFDSAGFWQSRRALEQFPTAVLYHVLEAVQRVIANR